MPSSTHETHRLGIADLNRRPVARVTPEEATGVLGAILPISGAGSTLEGRPSEDIRYAWTLTSPIGSEATLRFEDDLQQVAQLEGDVTGVYIVSLQVTANGLSSVPAEAALFFSAATVPAVRRHDVPGDFMFSVLSDFWRLVNDREVFPIVWSAYTQSVASDYLRAFQIDRAKSIATIQPLFQTRWMDFSPVVNITAGEVDAIFGYPQSGTGAFTGNVTFVGQGIVVSRRELRLLGGTTSLAIGTLLQIFAGSSAGEYRINRLSADGRGYVVSDSTPLPGKDVVYAGATLVAPTGALSEPYAPGVDFEARGVQEGDYLSITVGRNSGYYEVTSVAGAAIEVFPALPYRASNIAYEFLRPVRCSFLRPSGAFTSTVYIPRADADLTVYDAQDVRGTGQVLGQYEIEVQSEHVLDSALGKEIVIHSGALAGQRFPISTINSAGTGYVVSRAISLGDLAGSVKYSFVVGGGIRDRVLVLDGVGHQIGSYEIIGGLPAESAGGRGDLWAIKLASSSAPAGVEALPWRISPILRSSEQNFERLAVRAGDLLYLEVGRADLETATIVPAQVTGVAGSVVAFELGTGDLEYGRDSNGRFYRGELSAEEVLQISSDLSIPTVTISTAGEALLTSAALDIYALLSGATFRRALSNLPLDPTTLIDLGGFFSIRVYPKKIIRNSAITLGELVDPIYSIPALFEHPSATDTVETADGWQITHQDHTTSLSSRAPVGLVENTDFLLVGSSVSGSAASTTAGSATVQVADVSLISSGIRGGDTLELISGLSRGTFVIRAVLSETEMLVTPRDVDSRYPVATESAVQYAIARSERVTTIEMVRPFTPSSPMPEVLWAPLVLLENTRYIEDNFGALVGATEADLSRYGTTQITYRAAVAGLMYAWAHGPTLRSAEIGAHILGDLPVTEKLCEIVEINAEYTANYGRVLVEELTNEGTGTGLLQSYRYRRSDLYSLATFRGLALNPETGAVFAEGDILPPFTPLTNSILVTDRLVRPDWWREFSNVEGSVELRKYHTWQVEVDLQATDSRDLPLIADFLMKIRPIYTRPTVLGVLSLLDTVIVDDVVTFEMGAYLFDDPAFSRQSTHMFDDYSGSSVALRRVDFGSQGARTLFAGDDLEMSTGSGVVTSSRGGFLTGTVGDVTTLPRINQTFTDPVEIRGQGFVRPGDFLYVTSGPNRGRFEVSTVDSDTQLTVSQAAGEVPRSLEIAAIQDDEDALFHVLRDSGPILTSGATLTGVDANIVEDVGASFRSDGVTSDDRLVILSGANRGVYRILAAGVFNLSAEIFEEQETSLTLEHDLPDPEDLAEYRIERWALGVNPVFVSPAWGAIGSTVITAADADLQDIERDDRVVDMDSGAVYRVIAVVGDDIFVDRPLELNVGGDIEVNKLVFEEDGDDSDYRLERLMGYDLLEIDIYWPLTLVDSFGSMTLTTAGNVADAGAAPAAGVGDLLVILIAWTDSDFNSVPNPGEATTSVSHGAYRITEVSGNLITVDSNFPGVEVGVTAESGVAGETYTPAASFQITGTGDTVACADDVELLGVRPGDFVEIEEWTVAILEVSGAYLVLAEATDLTSGSWYTGRIFRREAP
jgi:hypothetical protein